MEPWYQNFQRLKLPNTIKDFQILRSKIPFK